ncbi:LamG domain-containing protein [Chloroflexota bacterium]
MKRILIAFIVTLMVTAVLSSAALATTDGLISWWRAGGDATDAVGTNDGVLVNGASFADGKVGQAFSFDGTDQFVEVPDAPNLNPTEQLTMAAWVFPIAVEDTNDIIINKETGSPFVIQYEMSVRQFNDTSGTYIYMFHLGGVSGFPNDGAGWVSGGQVPLNAWSHVALTFDGSLAKAYINGTVTKTFTGLSGNIRVTSGPLRIGTRSDNIIATHPDVFFNGLIDEVKIFDRALSGGEIQTLTVLPPGWDKGKKSGWEGSIPPGLEKKEKTPDGFDQGNKKGWE